MRSFLLPPVTERSEVLLSDIPPYGGAIYRFRDVIFCAMRKVIYASHSRGVLSCPRGAIFPQHLNLSPSCGII